MRGTGAVPTSLARPLARGGLIIFVSSLIYFAYSYVIVFGREADGPAGARAIAADVALFSVFALHHSVFARDAFRNPITRIVGALERSFYVWVASVLFIAVCALWQSVAGAAWHLDQPAVVWLLAAAQLAGLWLTLRSASLIDIRELSGLKQIDEAARIEIEAGRTGSDAARTLLGPREPFEFKTRGPYGWVRHPIYSGWFLLVFAVPVMTMTRLVFAVTSSVYLLIAIPFEERSLRRSTDGSYDRYMGKVRWKIIPGVY